jgi:3D (Asp-Asp-Asp) domain-containing protein
MWGAFPFPNAQCRRHQKIESFKRYDSPGWDSSGPHLDLTKIVAQIGVGAYTGLQIDQREECPTRQVNLLFCLAATLSAFALLTPVSALPPSSGTHRRPTIRYFIATAYSVEGTGASGKWSHPGTVAADRKVLPLNSRIRIYGAGRYSGDYIVEDTGAKVDGHHIDVYMPSQAEAKKFGRQRVKVVVLKYGDDEASPPDPQQKADAKAVNRKERAKANAAPTK